MLSTPNRSAVSDEINGVVSERAESEEVRAIVSNSRTNPGNRFSSASGRRFPRKSAVTISVNVIASTRKAKAPITIEPVASCRAISAIIAGIATIMNDKWPTTLYTMVANAASFPVTPYGPKRETSVTYEAAPPIGMTVATISRSAWVIRATPNGIRRPIRSRIAESVQVRNPCMSRALTTTSTSQCQSASRSSRMAWVSSARWRQTNTATSPTMSTLQIGWRSGNHDRLAVPLPARSSTEHHRITRAPSQGASP